MKYRIEFKPGALKDCRKISKSQLTHIFEQLEKMSDGLKGDVKGGTS
jgi:mRNA-degrading endonuclease RelE of RelBE toxin-antitoxin system